MLRDPRCIAPVLLASFVGVIATGAAARAEPASAAPAADADCLTKPDAQTAPGNHWYYHLDRASGRRCWYQRPASGAPSSAQNDAHSSAQNTDAGPTRSVPARAAVPPPAEGAADNANDTRDQAGAAPVTAAPAPLYSWPTAAPAPVPPEQMMAPASAGAAPAPAAAPQPATADEPASAAPPAAPPSRAPVRAATIERPAVPVEVEEGTHLPALLGAALALLIVVLGSIVARITASVIRSRRRDRALDAMAPPIYPARDAPGLVPVMPRERDITRKTRVRRSPTEMPAAREDGAQDGANLSGDASARIRDETRALEQNVRDLLRRLNGDLLREPRSPAAPAAPRPLSAQELDQALAAWRGRGRRRKPG